METITFIREILLAPLLEGTIVTLKLIAFSIPLGLFFGILIGTGRVYGNKFVSSFCTIYTLFFVAALYWCSFLFFIMVYHLSVFSFLPL